MQTQIDVLPLCHAIERQPELWNQNDMRSTYPGSPHNEVDDIWLRFDENPTDLKSVMDGHESVNYPALLALPQARPLIFGLMARVEGERLGRTMITRLKPGARIGAHVDSGDHAAYYDRYHVVLQGCAGSMFECGGETVNMRTGELWWFDNGVEHAVANNSADDRIHLIVDIRTTR